MSADSKESLIQAEQTLGKEQVDFAMELMREAHPLMYEPVYKPFPVLYPFKYIFGSCCEIFRTEEEQKEFLAKRVQNSETEPLLENK